MALTGVVVGPSRPYDAEQKELPMYAAVRRYEGIIDDDEAARLVGDSFMPELETVPGFIAYYWIDAGEGVMASLSVFEDKSRSRRVGEVRAPMDRGERAQSLPEPPASHRRPGGRERHEEIARPRLSCLIGGPKESGLSRFGTDREAVCPLLVEQKHNELWYAR